MIDPAPRFLFVPVSGAFGMGEYARSLAIAQGVAARWPSASIRFILSREAPYAASTPFAATMLASSPTFHSTAVIDVIRTWRPDVVIFDNAGRTAQLRAARRSGARVVYISARPRQRRKAFRLRWMRLIDEHWIAYPEFIAGELHSLERLKLTFMRRPAVRYLDVIMARDHGGGMERASGAHRDALMARLGCVPNSYVLVVPGGGTGHAGAPLAIQQFLDAAGMLAAAGIAAIFVGRAPPPSEDAGGPPCAEPTSAARLLQLGPLPQTDLALLMRGARLIIANGGSTLLQAIACAKACVAVPIAGDQRERIRRCSRAGVAVAAPLDSAVIAKTAMDLLRDDAALDTLAGRAIALGLADGVDVALRAMTTLLEPK
ncbi:MAG: hypothetical protein M3O41_20645 [Pseudomonadota bacterium]|nr:hypothetical protein [Pseudomonadota bacterium]